MKRKLLFLGLMFLHFLCSYGQNVPSYVPTNGLLAWYPFSGNANDLSGNGNNGSVNGATLSPDRYSMPNSAYSFDGVNDMITVLNGANFNPGLSGYTLAAWVKLNQLNSLTSIWTQNDVLCGAMWVQMASGGVAGQVVFGLKSGSNPAQTTLSYSISNTNWFHIVGVRETQTTVSLYINGLQVGTITNVDLGDVIPSSTNPIMIGGTPAGIGCPVPQYHEGLIDDIGVWKRALTPQEITVLYNSCVAPTFTLQPQNQTVIVGNNAQFTVSSSNANSTYQWQKDSGSGWATLTGAGQYSGANTNTLTVNNVTLADNNNWFRCIIDSGICETISNAAILTVNNNTVIGEDIDHHKLRIFPNPSESFITVEGIEIFDFTITNLIGQSCLSKGNNQGTINISTLPNGIYYLKINKVGKADDFEVLKFVKE